VIPFMADGAAVTCRFTTGESTALADLAQQLIDLLSERAPDTAGSVLFAQLGIGGESSGPLDPALARLLPDAYRGDVEAASEHRQLTERSLVERKIANARVVIASLDSAILERTELRLEPSEVQSWLRTLTDLRLALAARLQIADDGDNGIGDDEALMVYNWLGYLQGSMVEVIE